jgi:hypothetical protein
MLLLKSSASLLYIYDDLTKLALLNPYILTYPRSVLES